MHTKPLKCQWCGGPIVGRRATTLWCSARCRMAKYYHNNPTRQARRREKARRRPRIVERYAYYGAKARCNNPNLDNYHRYGGRGIKFKFKNFAHFFETLGPRPQGMTLDRIDVNGHYEPGNVRWATTRQQNSNKRSAPLYERLIGACC